MQSLKWNLSCRDLPCCIKQMFASCTYRRAMRYYALPYQQDGVEHRTCGILGNWLKNGGWQSKDSWRGGGAIYFRLSTGRGSGTWSSNQVLASSQNWNISALFHRNFLTHANQRYTLFFERRCISLFSTRQSAVEDLGESFCGQRNITFCKKSVFSSKMTWIFWISAVKHWTEQTRKEMKQACSHVGYYKMGTLRIWIEFFLGDKRMNSAFNRFYPVVWGRKSTAHDVGLYPQ